MANNEHQLIEFKEAHKQLDTDKKKILNTFETVLNTLQTGLGDTERRVVWIKEWKHLQQVWFLVLSIPFR